MVRPGRHVDGLDLRHRLVHHVEDGLGCVGNGLLPDNFSLLLFGLIGVIALCRNRERI